MDNRPIRNAVAIYLPHWIQKTKEKAEMDRNTENEPKEIKTDKNFMLPDGHPTMKLGLPDVLSTRDGQSGNCLFLTLLWQAQHRLHMHLNGEI